MGQVAQRPLLDYYPSNLSSGQVTAIRLKIKHPRMKSTGILPPNEVHSLDLG